MNIQTDPTRLKLPAHHFPAAPEQPIRAQFLHEDRLRALGESLARNEIPSLFGMETFDFQKRIREDAAKILDVYRSTNAAQTRGEMVTPAAQWLLDNNYLVEETIFQIKRDLPRRFYRELPTMTLPDGTTVPRALALAWIYVAHSDSTVAAHTFKSVVEGFQAIEPMKIGELWALPSLLRFVLIENLRRIAVRVNRARQMRQIANEVADRVLATPDDEDDQKDPRRLCGARARHDLRDAASLPAARRLAEFRQGAELAREGAGEIRHRRRRDHHRRASTRCPPATSPPATSSGACGSSTTSTGPSGSRTSAASTRCCGSARTSLRSISPRATSTARRSRIWRGARTSANSRWPRRPRNSPAIGNRRQRSRPRGKSRRRLSPSLPPSRRQPTMSASSWSDRAARNWSRRSATGPASAGGSPAPSAPPAGSASSCRSSC